MRCKDLYEESDRIVSIAATTQLPLTGAKRIQCTTVSGFGPSYDPESCVTYNTRVVCGEGRTLGSLEVSSLDPQHGFNSQRIVPPGTKCSVCDVNDRRLELGGP